MTADVLESIVAATRLRIRDGAYAAAAIPGPAPDGARFVSSLREPGARIIAEIKARSPSAGEILRNCDHKVETVSLAYRRGHAAAISVVTEREFFGGEPAWIARAKRISGLPVLMKDFILDDVQLDFAASHGADAVLLIASILEETRLRALRDGASRRGMAALVETHSEAEIGIAAGLGAEVIGVNARDLRTFGVSLETLVSLAPAIPGGCVGVAESGIRSRADVVRLEDAGYRAFLVGEALLRADDPEETLRELRGKSVTDVKVCGLTRPADVALAAALGASYVGFNCSARSPRRVDLGRADELARETGGAKRVGVFVDEEADDVRRAIDSLRLDLLQFHRELRAGDFGFGVPVVAVCRVAGAAAKWPDPVLLARSHALLFDTADRERAGGTGSPFEWGLLEGISAPVPLWLAGGLRAENVGEAIARTRPDLVDVASGVERSPGIKDRDKLEAFFLAVSRV